MGGLLLHMLAMAVMIAGAVLSDAAKEASRGDAQGIHPHLRKRALLLPPRDVYAMTLKNSLAVPVNSTFTFSKGITNWLMIEKKLLQPGMSFTSGPFEYKEGNATFQYILRTVKAKYWPAGADYSGQEALWLDSPFSGVTGITPLLEAELTPKEDDSTRQRMGALVLKIPTAA